MQQIVRLLSVGETAVSARVPRPSSVARVDLSALEPSVFSRLLEKAHEARHLPAELASEAAVRAGSGRLGVKELRLLLLRFKGSRLAEQATESAWAVVRARPEFATSVLHSHAQESGGDPLRVPIGSHTLRRSAVQLLVRDSSR